MNIHTYKTLHHPSFSHFPHTIVYLIQKNYTFHHVLIPLLLVLHTSLYLCDTKKCTLFTQKNRAFRAVLFYMIISLIQKFYPVSTCHVYSPVTLHPIFYSPVFVLVLVSFHVQVPFHVVFVFHVVFFVVVLFIFAGLLFMFMLRICSSSSLILFSFLVLSSHAFRVCFVSLFKASFNCFSNFDRSKLETSYE